MRICTVKDLRETIKDLPDELPIECEVHKLMNTYIIEDAYKCGNEVGEPILNLIIKSSYKLTKRDEEAFQEWCREHGYEEE